MKIFTSFLNLASNSDWIFLISIQLIILTFFVFTIRYFCKQLKIKEPEKPVKKTCILISFLSAIAWFIIAQIVWVITSIQMLGS
ncbi:MAG: hypothetical protein IPH62_05580 [Ignavibacteriae bacterium]|nr:hypothetical protein [Ignavibacteriota bacterium]